LDNKKTILITGVAGFIGFHICKRLIENGEAVIGIDNLNTYYDQNLKKDRLNELDKISKEINNSWIFKKGDIEDETFLAKIFISYKPNVVLHLAAQAGVRNSIDNPKVYIKSNIMGFGNVLECCREHKIENLIYASSSSVYGGNVNIPYSEADEVNHPVSLYAATKKSTEILAHSYSHLYQLPTTGLRFFTVYGPWGRPDMAPMIFTDALFKNKPLKVFNYGEMARDFTFIDDIVEVLIKLVDKPAKSDGDFNKKDPRAYSSWSPFRIFNIGNSESIKLLDFINHLEIEIGLKSKKQFLEMQQGDVKATSANTNLIEEWIGFKPKTPIKDGIKKFIKWYKIYYEI